jgi:serine/threonine protein kinase/tetratricopeptide (TPR) repeat protein
MATDAARKTCESCGATLHGESPAGLCPACLLTTAIEEGDPEESISGSRIQDYELLNEVARGGMGIVYRARQRVPPRIVALKMILPANVGSVDAMQRFRVEAEAAASLEHEGILPIYAVGEHDGAPFYSMKFAEGGTLSARIGNYRDKPREAAALVAKLARAVTFAHEHGILHRDLKPGNVLFDSAGKPYVSDFGLAKWLARESDLTQTFAVLGTPFYMAPEQAISPHMLTAGADVYSLGAILYHLLTGNPPFTGDTPMEVLRRAENLPVPRPRLTNRTIPSDLETICLKCLEKDPKRRYWSALALAEDLDHWLKHEPIRAKRSGFFTHSRRWVQRNPTSTLLAACLVVLAAASGWIVWKSELIRQPLTTGIAVLPFENLNEQKENTAFADGVQDDILTKLAKVADLKVISRTSVMEYRGKRNLRKIGNDLRVSHVLEGSVRRAGTHLRLNAQLIDTRTDTHVWAEQYDRDLNELFAIQSEIAQKVAERLNAKITAEEKVAIERPATADLDAFELYALARKLLPKFGSTIEAGVPRASQAVELLNQAVARDPSFLLAYLLLARIHEDLYRFGFDHTSARLAMAEAALQEASRLRPDAGETHLGRAAYLYAVRDYAGALAELEIAEPKLPNEPSVFAVKASIQRRQGHWGESTRNFQRAAELDPRNWTRLRELGRDYGALGRYVEQKSMFDRALALEPNNLDLKAEREEVELNWKADPRPLHQFLDSIRATNPGATPNIDDYRFICALAERDAAAAREVLSRISEMFEGVVHFTPTFMEGLIARMTNDEHKAQLAFAAARAEQEKIVQAQPDYGPPLCVLGLIDAALGRKEEALREGRRAVELMPMEKDALAGAQMITCLAMIAAWVGEKNLACEQLAIATRFPGGPPLSYGQLKLMPWWDPLRGEPCFDKIIAEAAKPIKFD